MSRMLSACLLYVKDNLYAARNPTPHTHHPHPNSINSTGRKTDVNQTDKRQATSTPTPLLINSCVKVYANAGKGKLTYLAFLSRFPRLPTPPIPPRLRDMQPF